MSKTTSINNLFKHDSSGLIVKADLRASLCSYQVEASEQEANDEADSAMDKFKQDENSRAQQQ